LTADAVALLAAGGLAFVAWAQPVRNQPIELYLPVLPLLFLILLGYAQAGLYPGFGMGPVETIRRYWLVTLAAFASLAGLVFALKIPDYYSRATLVLAAAFSLVFLPVGRWLVRRLARRWAWWREPVVLVGAGTRTRLALDLFDRSAGEYQPVGLLLTDPPESEQDADLPVLGSLSDADAVAAAGIQLAFADLEGPGAESALDRLRLVFSRVIILRDFTELPVEGVQVRNFGGVLGLEYGSNLLRRQTRWVKRCMDLAVGLVALVLTLPVIVLAVLAVRLRSPGPALFWQEREGLEGRTIRVPKIRTMIPDAEARMEELLATDDVLRAQWERGYKLREDPRLIPRLGRLLRRWSVDELPQLWSVVRGDMSLVGPRPFPHYHLEALSPQARDLRNRVRPGLTGLWQVSARGIADVGEQQYYDIYYIRNWSLWLDIYVLAHTVSAVVTGRGAF